LFGVSASGLVLDPVMTAGTYDLALHAEGDSTATVRVVQ